MDIHEKLEPVGHLEVIKKFSDGTEELVFEDRNVICSGLGQSIAEYMSKEECIVREPVTSKACAPITLNGQSAANITTDPTVDFMFGGGDGPRRTQLGTSRTTSTSNSAACPNACMGVLSLEVKGEMYWVDENGDHHKTWECTGEGISGHGYSVDGDCPPGWIVDELFDGTAKAVGIKGTLTRRTFCKCKDDIKCEDGSKSAGHKNRKGEWGSGQKANSGTFDYTWTEVVFLGCCTEGGGGLTQNFPYQKEYKTTTGWEERLESDDNVEEILDKYGKDGSNPPQFVGCSCNEKTSSEQSEQSTPQNRSY